MHKFAIWDAHMFILPTVEKVVKCFDLENQNHK